MRWHTLMRSAVEVSPSAALGAGPSSTPSPVMEMAPPGCTRPPKTHRRACDASTRPRLDRLKMAALQENLHGAFQARRLRANVARPCRCAETGRAGALDALGRALQGDSFLAWQQSLGVFNKDMWEQWACCYAGGVAIDG